MTHRATLVRRAIVMSTPQVVVTECWGQLAPPQLSPSFTASSLSETLTWMAYDPPAPAGPIDSVRWAQPCDERPTADTWAWPMTPGLLFGLGWAAHSSKLD